MAISYENLGVPDNRQADVIREKYAITAKQLMHIPENTTEKQKKKNLKW